MTKDEFIKAEKAWDEEALRITGWIYSMNKGKGPGFSLTAYVGPEAVPVESDLLSSRLSDKIKEILEAHLVDCLIARYGYIKDSEQ